MEQAWKGWVRPLAGAALLLAGTAVLTGKMVMDYRPVPPEALLIPAAPNNAPAPAKPSQTDRRSVFEPPQATPTHSVYRCTIDGVPTFSQTPCGVGARLQAVDPDSLNIYRAPPPSAPLQRAPSYAPRATAGNAAEPEADARCLAVEQEIREIQSAMRRPYTEPEGNYLRGRLHQLGGQLFELRCGR